MAVYCSLLDHLNKRFTLNLLIQGAASHTYLTAHHLVKQELDAIDRRLVRLYDKMALNVHLSQWMGDLVFAVGFPKKFWRTRPSLCPSSLSRQARSQTGSRR